MGNQCCGDKQYDEERIINEMEEFDKLAAFKKKSNRKRIALPSEPYAQKLDKNNQTEQSLLNYKLNERKFKKPVKIDIEHQSDNYLDQVYYLNYQIAYYIGQWVFDYDAGANIPEGIGKIYQKHFISEGQIQTQILKDLSEINLRTYINGKGRKYNKLEKMEGQFIKGKLWGKGVYVKKLDPINYVRDYAQSSQFKDANQTQYFYEGEWVNGERHGRGKQETRTYQYNGDFVHDIREGNGHYINILDGQKTHKIKLQQESLHDKIKELINQQKANKDKMVKFEEEKTERQQQINKILENYPWKSQFNNESLFEHPDFKRQRKIRTFYYESYNGQFKENKFHGQGTYTWYNGKIFTGNWVQGQMHGVGEFCWPDGTIYRGLYQHDKRHGKGEMIWCDTRRWRGSWAYGIRHGYGQTICVDSNYKFLIIQGSLWNRDKQQKIFFTKSHDLKTGLIQSQLQEDLLYREEVPQQNDQSLHFLNDPVTSMVALMDKSLTQSLKQKPMEGKSRQYGTQATWMKLNIFDE